MNTKPGYYVKNPSMCTVVLVCISLFSSLVSAAETPRIKLGEGLLTPSITLNLLNDDNVFFSQDNKQSSNTVSISPKIEYLADIRSNTFRLYYEGEHVNYLDLDWPSRKSHRLGTDTTLHLSRKSLLSINALYSIVDEQPGTASSIITDDPLEDADTLEQSSLAAKYRYGGESARGQLEFGIGYGNTEYDTDIFEDQKSTYSTLSPEASFYLRISPDTQVIVRANATEVDYNEFVGIPSQDRTNIQYLIGFRFKSTAATEAQFLIGQSTDRFSDNTRDDKNSLAINGNITWTPISTDSFNFNYNKSTTDDLTTRSLILSDRYGVTWEHSWSSVFSSNLGWSTIKEEDTEVDSNETANVLNAKLDYLFRSWLTFSLTFNSLERDSSINLLDGERRQYGLEVKASF